MQQKKIKDISIFSKSGYLVSGAIGHNYEMGIHKDNFSKIWCNLVQQFQRRFKCDFLSKYARLLLFVFNQV